MVTVFLQVLSLFALVFIGFVCVKTGHLSSGIGKPLSFIVMSICCPALIFSSLSAQSITPENTKTLFEIIICALIYFTIFSAILLILFRALKIGPSSDHGLQAVLACAINTGFLGYPITYTIFGNKFFFYMIIVDLILSIYVLVISVSIMNFGNTPKSGYSVLAYLRPIASPIMIGIFLGIVSIVFKIHFPDIILDTCSLIGGATTPLALITLGIQLANSNISNFINDKRIILLTFLNLVVVPSITTLFLLPVNISNDAKLIMALAASFPCAVMVSSIAEKEGKNTTLASQVISSTTFFSIFSLPIWINIISRLFL